MNNSRMLAWIVVAVLFAGFALPVHSRAAESWQSGQVPSPATVTAVRDRTGRLWTAWEVNSGQDAEVVFSRQVSGVWSAARPISHRPDAWDRSPSLSLASDGTLWVAWSSALREAPDRSALYVSRWNGSRWSEPSAVPMGVVVEGTEPFLASGPDGTMWLAWVGFDGVDDEIWANEWDGQDWSSPRRVGTDDQERHLYDRQPRLAVGDDGNPWLVWTAHQDGLDDEIMFSRWNGVRWSPEQAVSSDDDLLDVWPSVAFDSEGRAWVAWHGSTRDGTPGEHRILVSRWSPDRGEWTAEEIVSSPESAAVDEMRPSLVPDDAGGMHVAWVATGQASTLLAHTRWSAEPESLSGEPEYPSGGYWSAPVVVEEAANVEAVRAVGGSLGLPTLLWLDAGAAVSNPMRSATLTDAAEPLDETLDRQEADDTTLIPPIPNRFLAFGDSITWGAYPTDDPVQDPFYPYPSVLEDTFDTRVFDVDVINVGVPGEQTRNGKDRIDDEILTHLPQYVLIMEGTNDVSHLRLPAEVYQYMLLMIDTARHTDVERVKVLLATLPPRLDDLNDETRDMNLDAMIPAASEKNIPLCDVWTAFYSYVNAEGMPLENIYYDSKHPDQEGLNLLAATWYDCLRSNYSWLGEESIPPTTWIESLPSDVGCNEDIPVSWTGTDNLSWIADYDVQVSIDGGGWTPWLTGVEQTSGTYPAQAYGAVVGFQVRGRDMAGNVSDWSAPAYATVSGGGDLTAYVNPMPATQPVPFGVSWGGSGSCGPVAAYDVQYRIGAGTWVDWKYRTTDTSAVFDPVDPQYGQVHYFRAWAVDALGNMSPASPEVQTLVARYTVTGWVYNVRHERVANPQVSMVPAPAVLRRVAGGGFAAYLADGGTFDVQVSRDDLYGPLPPMQGLVVNDDVIGLTFVLPPADDAIVDGDFEAGSLDGWQPGGTTPPVLSAQAHTGAGAARLGGGVAGSTLSQVITPALDLSDPTLSFMVRLENAGVASSVDVVLSNSTTLSPPVTYTLPVADAAWTHAWFDVTGLVSEPLTLTFRVEGAQAILLDEVSLGSALPGGYLLYLPVLARGR